MLQMYIFYFCGGNNQFSSIYRLKITLLINMFVFFILNQGSISLVIWSFLHRAFDAPISDKKLADSELFFRMQKLTAFFYFMNNIQSKREIENTRVPQRQVTNNQKKKLHGPLILISGKASRKIPNNHNPEDIKKVAKLDPIEKPNASSKLRLNFSGLMLQTPTRKQQSRISHSNRQLSKNISNNSIPAQQMQSSKRKQINQNPKRIIVTQPQQQQSPIKFRKRQIKNVSFKDPLGKVHSLSNNNLNLSQKHDKMQKQILIIPTSKNNIVATQQQSKLQNRTNTQLKSTSLSHTPHTSQNNLDRSINNFTWNESVLQKILKQLDIKTQKELNDFLDNKSEYFINMFQSASSSSVGFNLYNFSRQTDKIKYKNQQLINTRIPQIKMQDYECLSQLENHKGRLPQRLRITTHESQFYLKKSKTEKKIIPISNLQLDESPQIINQTTSKRELPNRHDYDPTRIFKRLQENTVVLGAKLSSRTQYRKTYKEEANLLQEKNLVEEIKQKNKGQSNLYTKINQPYETAYFNSFLDRKPEYFPPPFKFHTQIQKVTNDKKLPAEAYTTTKVHDTREIKNIADEIKKNERKYMQPWKYKLASKLKAIMQYKNFLKKS